jgi:hypothetical protein
MAGFKRNSGMPVGRSRAVHRYLLVEVPDAGGVVVSALSCLHPTSAKQATSVSNAISFIVELLLFPYCERPGPAPAGLALTRRTLTHCLWLAKPFFYLLAF